MFKKKKPTTPAEKKYEVYEESQKNFLESANMTINLTKDIAGIMSNKIDNYLRHIDATANILTDALIVVDSFGLIKKINPAGEKVFGWLNDEIKNKRITNLFHMKDDKKLSCEKLKEILINEGCYNVGTILHGSNIGLYGLSKDKINFDIDLSASTYINSENEEITLLLIQDVSEQEKIKNDLKIKKEHYKAIFEMSFDSIGIIKDFIIIEANRSFLSLFGGKGILGRNFCDFIRPECLDQFMHTHERHLHGEECSFELELGCIRDDGKHIDIIFSSSLVGSAENEYASLITLKDITFRKQMENRFKESEKKYKSIFEQTFNGVVVVQDFKFVAVNPAFCEIIEKTKKELIDTNIMEYLSHECKDEVKELHLKRMNGNTDIVNFVVKFDGDLKIKIFSATTNHVVWNNRPASLITLVPLE